MFHKPPLKPIKKITEELRELESALLRDDYVDPDDWAEVKEAYDIMYKLMCKIADIPF